MVIISLLTGCKKEQDQSLKLEAVIENVSDGQKVHIGTYNGHNLPYWDANDEVRVNNETGSIAFDNAASYIQITNTASTYCAIYPSSCLAANTNISNPSSITITLPKEQVYEENSGNQIVRLPMIAYSNTTDLHFKNLCSVFKITVSNGTTEDVVLESIVLKATANSGGAPVNLWGTATVSLAADAYTDQTTPAGISTLNNSDTYRNYVILKNIHKTIPTSGNVSKDFYIVVPTTSTATDYTVQLNYLGGFVSYAAATNKKYPVSARNLGFNDEVKALTIIGPFTVSSGSKKVGFAKGNLWFNKTNNTYNFETNQSDYTPSVNTNVEPHISHFHWKKAILPGYDQTYDPSNNPSSNNQYLFTNSDKTRPNPNFTVNVIQGVFRCLSAEEWYYLLNRSGGSNGKTWAIVNAAILHPYNGNNYTTQGLIILPDGSTANPRDLRDLTSIQSAGAVFLPNAGVREYGDIMTCNDSWFHNALYSAYQSPYHAGGCDWPAEPNYWGWGRYCCSDGYCSSSSSEIYDLHFWFNNYNGQYGVESWETNVPKGGTLGVGGQGGNTISDVRKTARAIRLVVNYPPANKSN